MEFIEFSLSLPPSLVAVFPMSFHCLVKRRLDLRSLSEPTISCGGSPSPPASSRATVCRFISSSSSCHCNYHNYFHSCGDRLRYAFESEMETETELHCVWAFRCGECQLMLR